MAKRKVPDLNSSSTADMAFLLLIFFLITTTMNVDSGIQRTLPQWTEEDVPMDIRERNVMRVLVNQNNQIMFDGQRVELFQVKDLTLAYLLSDVPERIVEDIELLGSYPVSQGTISLINNRQTNYDTYIKVQNELTRAFNEIRDMLSNQKFGQRYAELDEPRQRAIGHAVQVRISEAEPTDHVTGQ